MKKHRFVPILLTALGLTTFVYSADVGIVNFGTCVADSKIGKQEQSSFESLKKQMTTLLEDTEKQLNEMSAKFNDPDYLDGLSPEAEEELKVKFRTLNEELGRYQNQYYQVMNQANMRIVQTMSTNIAAASEKVAKDKKLTMIVNKDACFYFSPALDVTSLVVAEMDKNFNSTKKVTASADEAVPEQQKTETKK
jgi:outer membrane protein